MCVWLHSDEPTKGGTRAIIERVLVKEVAGGVRRDMVLQRARVELLVAIGDGDCKKIAPPAFTDKAAQTFETRVAPAQMQVEAHRRGVVIDRGRVHLQRANVLAPGLRANVSDFRARSGNEVVHPASKA